MATQDINIILEKANKYISGLFNYKVMILLNNEKYKFDTAIHSFNKEDFNEKEFTVSNWVLEQGSSAGLGTDTLSSAQCYHIPLKVQEITIGVMTICPNDTITKDKNI